MSDVSGNKNLDIEKVDSLEVNTVAGKYRLDLQFRIFVIVNLKNKRILKSGFSEKGKVDSLNLRKGETWFAVQNFCKLSQSVSTSQTEISSWSTVLTNVEQNINKIKRRVYRIYIYNYLHFNTAGTVSIWKSTADIG